MNNARLKELERGQTSIARKVLELVPHQTSWTSQQIHSEGARLGRHIERRILDGCLASLVANGLVREPVPGFFIRPAAKPTLVETMPTHIAVDAALGPRTLVDAMPTPVAALASKEGHMDQFAALAARLRRLSGEAAAIAGEVEDAAVEVEETMHKLRDQGENLRKFKELLKSID